MNVRFKIFLFHLIPKSLLSRFFGYITLIPLPGVLLERIIRWYSVKYGVNLEEAVIPDKGFRNLNSFFTRALKKNARKISGGRDDIVATTDSRIDQYGTITGDSIIQAKGINYSLRELVPSGMAEKFIGGSFITLYLSPGDYHRIHSPVAGEITGYFHIPGKLYTVQDFMVKGLRGLFSVNERLITYIKTKKGHVAVCKIGAFNVGKISLAYDRPVTNGFIRGRKEVLYGEKDYISVGKGDEIGIFNLGSTVIVLFEKNAMKFRGLKTGSTVQVGEKIGEFISSRKK